MALLGTLLPALTTSIGLISVTPSGSGVISVTANGRNGRPACKFTDGSGALVPFLSAASTLWLNLAFTNGAFVRSDRLLCSLWGNSHRQLGFGWQSDGTFTVERFVGDTGRSVIGTIYLNPAVNHVLDIRIVVHASAGSVDVYVDGLTAATLSLSGVNTQRDSTAISAIMAGWGEGVGFTGDIQYIEHLLAMTETDTGDGWHGRQGSIVLDPMRPDSAGDQTDGTPTSGANYTNVDDTDADGDANVVAFSAAGGDRYGLTAPAFTTGSIKSVLVAALMKKDDAGTVTARTQIKSNATVATSATVAVATDYAYVIGAYGTDPNGSVTWTPAALGALLAGPERVT